MENRKIQLYRVGYKTALWLICCLNSFLITTDAKTRRMTVCNKSFERETSNNVHFPVIQLCGKWLHESGFKAGHTIDITYEDGKVIITKAALQRFDVK